MPSKTISYFLLSACPAGWTAADGANGTPDLRGRFIRATDLGTCRGEVCNRVAGSFQAQSIQSHQHMIHYTRGYDNTPGGAGVPTSRSGDYIAGSNILTQASGGVETRPDNIALLACMKE